MVEICALASGSNGNCYYIGNGEDAVLVDVGISRKQVLLRMAKLGLNPKKVKAIFISHEHADHMRGVKVLSKVLDVPVYMTKLTYEKCWNPNRPMNYAFFKPGVPVDIGSVTIHPFIKKHDAVEPCSFRVSVNGHEVGVFTDIGEPCENLVQNFKVCNAVFLESNYDENMLWNGAYPYHLKQRVASANGHLSNIQAQNLVKEFGHSHLKHIFLSHISQENNTPELAMSAFSELKTLFAIYLTSRYDASELITLK